VARADGTEKVGTVLAAGGGKKKVEMIETSFGKIVANKEVLAEPTLLSLHRVFPPRFFAIRSDFSAVEFVRRDVLPEMVEKKTVVEHSSQRSVALVTRHLPGEVPTIYFEYEGLTKPARSTLLKTLHIPKAKAKPAKGAAPPSPAAAADAIAAFLTETSVFAEQMNDVLEHNQQQYADELRPPDRPPPENIKVPPHTPAPRMQLMRYNREQPNVETAEALNYWESHEADFGYPLTTRRMAPRPVSSRRYLHDPPRWFKRYAEADADDEESETFALTEPTVPMRICECESPRRALPGLVISPEEISFGNVPGDKSVSTALVVANTGERPIHYSFAQIECPVVKLRSIPGVVFPGLKVTIHLEVEKAGPQAVKTALKILTNRGFEIVIPISGTIGGP
jgi:hypothetical protein